MGILVVGGLVALGVYVANGWRGPRDEGGKADGGSGEPRLNPPPWRGPGAMPGTPGALPPEVRKAMGAQNDKKLPPDLMKALRESGGKGLPPGLLRSLGVSGVSGASGPAMPPRPRDVPAFWPPDVPTPPGGTLQTQIALENRLSLVYQTPRATADTVAHYGAWMEKLGWVPQDTRVSAEGTRLTYAKGGRLARVGVAAPRDGQSAVFLTVETKAPPAGMSPAGKAPPRPPAPPRTPPPRPGPAGARPVPAPPTP